MAVETGPTITDEQKLAVETAWGVLHSAFPGASRNEIIQRHLLPHPLVAVGASVVCHGDDPETGERVVLVIDRKEINSAGRHFLGLLGGYVEIDGVRNVPDGTKTFLRCEQPDEGAVAEAAEESKDGNDRSIVQLTTDQLELVTGGINDHVKPHVAYYSYIAELSGTEILAIKKHIHDMQSDETYKSNTLKYNKREVFGMHLLNINDASALPSSDFRYHHTWISLQNALERIGAATRHSPHASAVLTAAHPK
jgi:hypothetical protein